VKSLRRVVGSFRYACAGLAYVVRTQPNCQVHLLALVLVVALGLWLALPLHELAILALTIGLVLAAEAINTAIEATVDLVSPEFHPLARAAKDAAAGAVLVAAAASVVVGCLLLLPPLLARLR
jgi:diacylglycerol kinase